MAPIDGNYYSNGDGLFHGGPSDFDNFFDSKICDFEDLFNNVLEGIKGINSGHGVDPGPFAGMIWNAVTKIAGETGVPDVLIFCIILQECDGNLFCAAGKDGDGNFTPGIMQCENAPDGSQLDANSMTQDVVDQMVRVGTHHLQGNLSDPQSNGNWYAALRLYNSGGMPGNGDLTQDPDQGKSTTGYVSDVANRFHGCALRGPIFN